MFWIDPPPFLCGSEYSRRIGNTANILFWWDAEPTSAIPADNGDLVLPDFHDGIAADAEETIPEKILTANCSAATWHNAFQVRKIDCIPYAAFNSHANLFALNCTIRVQNDYIL